MKNNNSTDYEFEKQAAIKKGFPLNQMKEMEKICGKSKQALILRFREWSILNG